MMKPSAIRTILILLVAGVIIAGARIGYDYYAATTAGYSAVMLSTGDVYFGKVTHTNSHYVILHDVYYPQVVQGQDASQQQGIKLIQFGTEFHGPEGTMEINRDHVIMIQPLRPDSQVIKTIQEYEAGLNK